MKRLLLSTMLMVGSVLHGQTVSQGDPAAVTQAFEFHSPMVIETVFPAATPALWRDTESLQPGKTPKYVKSGWFSVPEWYDLGKYAVDGVSLRSSVSKGFVGADKGVWEQPGLEMKVKPGPTKVEITIEATVNSRKFIHDKVVTVVFDVLNEAGGAMATASVTFKVEEKAENDGRVKFELTPEQVAAAKGLRLTVSTVDY